MQGLLRPRLGTSAVFYSPKQMTKPTHVQEVGVGTGVVKDYGEKAK